MRDAPRAALIRWLRGCIIARLLAEAGDVVGEPTSLRGMALPLSRSWTISGVWPRPRQAPAGAVRSEAPWALGTASSETSWVWW